MVGSGALLGSGSLAIFHHVCVGYDILSGTSSGGSFMFDSCTSWDTTIEIPALHWMKKEFSQSIFAGEVLFLKWSLVLFLVIVSGRWLFRIITRWKRPIIRVQVINPGSRRRKKR